VLASTGHHFATPSILTWPHTMWFLFLSPLQTKVTWALILVDRGDHHCHKGSRMGPSCKYLSAIFTFWVLHPVAHLSNWNFVAIDGIVKNQLDLSAMFTAAIPISADLHSSQ
jgi:hypothetical protein